MKRPIIGVSCMNARDAHDSDLMAVRPTYLRAIEAAGGVPLLIHLTDDLDVVRSLYALCDGVLLPGGIDVDPARYGEEPIPELGEVDRQRDEVEIALARWTRDDKKPLMGICRGIQVINVAFGGTLYQDIPSQLAETFDHQANTKMRQYDVLTHGIALEPDSWLAERLSRDEVMGNTMHHQAVKDLAPGMRVVGRAPDGVVEAMEGTGEQFVVAVQCHPEHLWASAETRWLRVFEGFVAACNR
ncbi:gamma-glutamyl-gamma-aminobutyrate hydrolase family protein [Oscillochloris sp. ZM17-4]|uniref:gamma-glutamyl-gamma-aminobutyrate hydrolase family protein n=1 Tax=Oscillochloris sp. ZM17-4 TaxID=2866714 RepID=UPI001C72D301|nr:gamma-glutamyl-gamma-aminobutyrate hydrolase family protein [Oscillochloris sp. ZM17-4]MBX0328949.1 gamma-glutamyl-gamma-aminobutyrate hydrolase family protein [Oscillochloris sp. ZM17-4]